MKFVLFCSAFILMANQVLAAPSTNGVKNKRLVCVSLNANVQQEYFGEINNNPGQTTPVAVPGQPANNPGVACVWDTFDKKHEHTMVVHHQDGAQQPVCEVAYEGDKVALVSNVNNVCVLHENYFNHYVMAIITK